MFSTVSDNRPDPAEPASLCGLRRVERVRVVVGDGHPVAVVTGVAHRYPHDFRISMATALRLADAGVPMQIEYRGDRGHSESGSRELRLRAARGALPSGSDRRDERR
jgi:hypothetical protein